MVSVKVMSSSELKFFIDTFFCKPLYTNYVIDWNLCHYATATWNDFLCLNTISELRIRPKEKLVVSVMPR